jgi:hypothetical protein|tara:strand:+ start:828 stop:1544 length:717 start_codon:yes stop_codon:yes gene_type:complete
MNNKIFLFLFLVFLLPLVSATQTYKVNQEFNLTTTCFNFSCNKVSTTIFYPNGTIFKENESMTNNLYYANLLITPESNGNYLVYFSDGTNTTETSFLITPTGFDFTTEKAIIYVVLFIVMLFVFVMNIWFINQLPQRNEQDEEGRIMSISFLKYLRSPLWFIEWMLFIGILFLSSNVAFAYLETELFAQILLTLFKISFGITPLILIVLVLWIFVQMFHDKQFQDMLNKGVFPQGRRL